MPWRPLGLRRFHVAGMASCVLPSGQMYALASLGTPLLLGGGHATRCTTKGPHVHPGVPWGPVLLWDNSVQRQGSDVRPAVPWVSASFAW